MNKMPFSALLNPTHARAVLMTVLLLVPSAQAQEQPTVASETATPPPAQTQTLVTSSGQGFPWGLLGLLGLMGLGRRSKTVVISGEAGLDKNSPKPPKPRPAKQSKAAAPPAEETVQSTAQPEISMNFEQPAEQVFYSSEPENSEEKVKIGR